MTEKRFKITKSKLVQNAHVIVDGKKQFTFPTLVGDNKGLIAYEKALNKLSEENKQLKQENNELRQDNDIKFWKLQCMHYFNSNSLFMSEISRAIKKGYEVSDKFQEYVDELKENNKEIKEKNKRLFGDSE